MSLKGIVVDARHKYLEAEHLLNQALDIKAQSEGENRSDVAAALNILAGLYYNQGRYTEAKTSLQRAMEIKKETSGEDHLDMGTLYSNMAIFLDSHGTAEEATNFWDHAINNYSQQFIRYFPAYSEQERLQYVDTVDPSFSRFYSFCVAKHDDLLPLSGELLDAILLRKALVLSQGTSERQAIIASGDGTLIALINQLSLKKGQIAQIYFNEELSAEKGPEVLRNLKREVSKLEKELAGGSLEYVTAKEGRNVSWEQVRDVLKPGEACLDFLYFQPKVIKRGTEVQPNIAAVVVLPNSEIPTIVKLGDLSSFGMAKKGYLLNTVERGVHLLNQEKFPDLIDLYNFVWAPLDSLLIGTERIYISGSGELLELNLGLAQDESKQYVMDRYELHYVNSLRQLLSEKKKYTNQRALLVGSPDFGLTSSNYELAMADTHAKRGKRPLAFSDAIRRGGCFSSWGHLQETQVEVEIIGEMLDESSWETSIYVGQNALEEIVKRAEGYRVLHLATHGFFCPDEELELDVGFLQVSDSTDKTVTDPLLRSGLVFAGANKLDPSAMRDDGLLTAYELKDINLRDTELVILSACETGLGDVTVGEGVFGLRRAFALAGAGAVVMSLWSVPDRETQELMANFYDLWLGGQDKYTAFSNAQRQQREIVIERYDKDLPYYWGAFVMVEN